MATRMSNRLVKPPVWWAPRKVGNRHDGMTHYIMTENGVEGDHPVDGEVVVLKDDDGNIIDYSATKINPILV
jgi:hypothetical protein